MSEDMFWVLKEQIKFGSDFSSNPRDHACSVVLFRIPIESGYIRLVNYELYRAVLNELTELKSKTKE